MNRQLDKAVSLYHHAKTTLESETKLLKKERERLEYIQEAQRILQGIAESVQQSAHAQIAGIVTRCLRAVFDDDGYEFHVAFERKRGKTEAVMYFTKDGHRLELDDDAGGVLDVISFALRLACILLSRPRRRRLLVADEPMKFVNGGKYQSRVAELLESLAKDLDFQMVIVTDDDWLKVGKIIDLEKE
jgi:DNA repair exonuclease SbcCD ATPase subunit